MWRPVTTWNLFKTCSDAHFSDFSKFLLNIYAWFCCLSDMVWWCLAACLQPKYLPGLPSIQDHLLHPGNSPSIFPANNCHEYSLQLRHLEIVVKKKTRGKNRSRNCGPEQGQKKGGCKKKLYKWKLYISRILSLFSITMWSQSSKKEERRWARWPAF